MTLPEAIEQYRLARAERRTVCRKDCDWPQGDGQCGYCAQERRALWDLFTLLGLND